MLVKVHTYDLRHLPAAQLLWFEVFGTPSSDVSMIEHHHEDQCAGLGDSDEPMPTDYIIKGAQETSGVRVPAAVSQDECNLRPTGIDDRSQAAL